MASSCRSRLIPGTSTSDGANTHLGRRRIFAARWAEGQALTLEQAIAYALATPPAQEAAPRVVGERVATLLLPTYPAGLTAREVEVLHLMTQGLPYAEIAAKLVISRRTVNAHVTSIFSKLGVTTRVVATRFAIDHHLG